MRSASPPLAAASAAYCTVNGYDVNRSGYSLTYIGASASGMNCASVRYAQRAVRRQHRRQYGYPRLAGPFFDGYVTWHCRKTGGYNVRCSEYTTGTSFGFRVVVHY